MGRYPRLIVEGQHGLHLLRSEPTAQLIRSQSLEVHVEPGIEAGQAAGQAADR